MDKDNMDMADQSRKRTVPELSVQMAESANSASEHDEFSIRDCTMANQR